MAPSWHPQQPAHIDDLSPSSFRRSAPLLSVDTTMLIFPPTGLAAGPGWSPSCRSQPQRLENVVAWPPGRPTHPTYPFFKFSLMYLPGEPKGPSGPSADKGLVSSVARTGGLACLTTAGLHKNFIEVSGSRCLGHHRQVYTIDVPRHVVGTANHTRYVGGPTRRCSALWVVTDTTAIAWLQYLVPVLSSLLSNGAWW